MRLNFSEIEDLNRSNLLRYNSKSFFKGMVLILLSRANSQKARSALKLIAISTIRKNLMLCKTFDIGNL